VWEKKKKVRTLHVDKTHVGDYYDLRWFFRSSFFSIHIHISCLYKSKKMIFYCLIDKRDNFGMKKRNGCRVRQHVKFEECRLSNYRKR